MRSGKGVFVTAAVVVLSMAGLLAWGSEPRVGLLWEEVQPTTSAPQKEDLVLGKRVYDTHCLGCHGQSGDGRSSASLFLPVPPRDFTSGTFKYHSATSALPSDKDLFRTITVGFPAFGMPSFRQLSEEERWATLSFIKTFYPRWKKDAEDEVPLDPGTEPGRKSGWEERGKDLYENLFECAKCHGLKGHADGPSAATLKDSWGNRIDAVDFSLGPVFRKNGWRPRDTVRILMTGISGTPMPAYWFEGQDRTQLWQVAWYVEFLGENGADE